MRRGILAIFAILFLLNFSTGVHAAVSPYPTSGTSGEQQTWILSNPDNFDPEDSSQAEAFVQAYDAGKINLNDKNQRGLVQKYLFSKDAIALEDRNILDDFLSYKLKGVKVDLKKGEGISFYEKDGKLFLGSGDGQEHDLDELNFLNIQGRKLEKVQSHDDGTIELFYGENSIHLKDAVLSKNKFGDLVFGSEVLKLGENFGKLILDGSNAAVLCTDKYLCRFSLGGMNVELNSNGAFYDLGNNRFSMVDGTTRIGKDLIAGSSEFSTNSQQSGIDFNKKIELRKFSPDSATGFKSSFVKVDSNIFGNVAVNSGKAEKSVIACFGCGDFTNKNDYDGYAYLKKQTNSKCLANCGKNFNAELKGFAATKFENDVIHQGFDKNLLVSYDDSAGTFKLNSCEGCGVGKGSIVGAQAINENFMTIRNEFYDDNHKISQLRYKLQLNGASSAVPYMSYILGNGEGITFADKDIYTTSASQDVLNTGVYRTTTLTGKDYGAKSFKDSIKDYYNARLGDATGFLPESISKTNDKVREALQSQSYGRKISIEDLNAFNYDSKGRKINVANLYVVNGDGSVLINQVDPALLREYVNHFNINGDNLADSYKRDQKLLSAIIDVGKGRGEYNEKVSQLVRSILKTYPSADAEKALGNYVDVIKGTGEIENLYNKGYSLPDICGNPSQPEIQKACGEPRMMIAWKKAAGTLSENDISSAIKIYTAKNGDYLYNPLHGAEVLADYTSTKLETQQNKNAFLNYVNNLEQHGAMIIPSTSITNFLKNVEYVQVDGGYIPIRDPAMIKLIQEGKVSKQTIKDISTLITQYNNDDFSKGLKLAAEAVVPKDLFQLGINVVPSMGPLGKSFIVLMEANGVLGVTKAAGALGLKGIGATLIGYSGGDAAAVSRVDALSVLKPNNLDEIKSIGKIPYNPGTQQKLYFNSLALKLEDALQLAPDEKLEIIALNKKFSPLGSSDEKVGILSISKTKIDPATGKSTGESQSIATGFLHTSKDGALKHIQNLEEIDSELANNYGINFNQKFAGAVSFDGPVSGTIVLREPSTTTFAQEIKTLPKDDRESLLNLYKGCCEPKILSDAPSVITEEGLYRLIPHDGTPITVESGVLPRIVPQNTLLQIMSGKSPELKPIVLDTELGVTGYFNDLGRFYERELQLQPKSLNFRKSSGSLTNDVGIFYDDADTPVLVTKVYEGSTGALKEAENLASVNLIERDLVPQVIDIANVPSLKSATSIGSETGTGSVLVMEAVPGQSLDVGLNDLVKLQGSARTGRLQALETEASGAGDALARLHHALPPRELTKINPTEIDDSARKMGTILDDLDLDQKTKKLYNSKIKSLNGKFAQSNNLVAFGQGDLHLDNILIDKGKAKIIDLETAGITSNRGTDLVRYADALDNAAQRLGIINADVEKLKQAFYDGYFKKYSSKAGISKDDFNSMIEFSQIESALTKLQTARGSQSIQEARTSLNRILGS